MGGAQASGLGQEILKTSSSLVAPLMSENAIVSIREKGFYHVEAAALKNRVAQNALR